MKRWLFFLPIILTLGLGGFLYWGLKPDRDPSALPSALLGKSAPEFMLEGIDGLPVPGLQYDDLLYPNQVALVNFFASWCAPCRAEHATFLQLSGNSNILLYGINYKDESDDALTWLQELGNPYTRIGADLSGRVALDWGLSGVPETFIVNSDGIIIYHHRGPLVGAQALEELNRHLKSLWN